MRNLIIFIGKHHFVLLFITLEIISFSLIINNSYYQQLVFLNATNEMTGKVNNTISNITGYFDLKETNKQLAEENARLRSSAVNSFIKTSDSVFIINDTLYRQQYRYVEAKVIKNSYNKRNNYLMLNKGSDQGVKKEMAVITSNGIVGIVNEVSKNFSSIMSVLHKDTKISAMIRKSKYKGTIVWNESDYKTGNLIDIEPHVKFSKGDTVVTSGNSHIFPEGIFIGTIKSYSIKPGDNFYSIKINFSTDFNRVEYVYIVKNFYKEEQLKLLNTQKNEQ